MKPVRPPPAKPEHLEEIAAIRAELRAGAQGSSQAKRYARSEWLWQRLFTLSPRDRWQISPPDEAVSPRGERIYQVRSNPIAIGNGEHIYQHIYSTVMNSPGSKGKFNFDYEGVGYELRGLDWRTGRALPRHFIPYDWGNELTGESAGNKLPVMPKLSPEVIRRRRIRKAYINYRLELADSSQKAVALLAKTTPATVSRVIAGIREEGEVTERVWSALRDCAKTPIKDLKDPPAMPEEVVPRAR